MTKFNVLILTSFLITSVTVSFPAHASINKSDTKNASKGIKLKQKISSAISYDIKMDLSLNGKVISSPQIIAKDGEVASITSGTEDGEHFIEVTAIEESILGNKGIMMTFVMGKIEKDGQRIILSKPQLFAKENQKSEVVVEPIAEQVDGGVGQEMLSLSVIAKRK